MMVSKCSFVTSLCECCVDILVISVMLESPSYSVVENMTVEICLMLDGQLEREVQLTVTSLSETAQQNEDYSAIVDQLSVHPGDGRVCFTVEALEDDLVEGDETFQVVLDRIDPAVVIRGTNAVTVNVKDNDSKHCALYKLHTTIPFL